MADQQDLDIFLDFGGVIGDGGPSPDRWRRLLGEYFAPRYGGSPEIWCEANEVVYAAYWKRYQGEVWGHPDLDYNAYLRPNQLRWLREPFE